MKVVNPLKPISSRIVKNIIGKDKYSYNNIENKFNLDEWINTMKKRGYSIHQDAKCPRCGNRAVSMISDSVIHAKCSTCNWSDTGFGGPKVMTWEQAVAKSRR